MSKRGTKPTRKAKPTSEAEAIYVLTDSPELVTTETKTEIRKLGGKDVKRSETTTYISPQAKCAILSRYAGVPQKSKSTVFDSPVNKRLIDVDRVIPKSTPSTTTQNYKRASGKNTAGNPLCFAKAYIFNNETFEEKLDLEDRYGSREDAHLLETTLQSFNTKVQIITDATKKEIKETVKEIAQDDYSSSECLIIAVLSHGDSHGIIYAHDDTYQFHEELVHPILENEALFDKPKIYFVQACKGSLNLGAELKKDGVAPPADLLIFYSSFEGFRSYRHKRSDKYAGSQQALEQPVGSLFIRSLCKILNEEGDEMDLRSITDKVIDDVSHEMRAPREENGKKRYAVQIPCVEGTFKRNDFRLPSRTKK